MRRLSILSTLLLSLVMAASSQATHFTLGNGFPVIDTGYCGIFYGMDGITSDGTWLYGMINGYPAEIHKYDPSTGSLVDTLWLAGRVDRAQGLGFLNGNLWIPNTPPGPTTTNFLEVDPTNGVTLRSLPSPSSSKVVGITTDGENLIFCDIGGEMYFMDPTNWTVVGNFGTSHIYYGLEYNPEDEMLYGVVFAGSTIDVLNPTNGLIFEEHTYEGNWARGLAFIDEKSYIQWGHEVYELVPEPATVLLLGLGAIFLRRNR